MRLKSLIPPLFVAIVCCVLLFFSCKKNDRDRLAADDSAQGFTVKAARGYFYKTIKKQFLASTGKFNKKVLSIYPFWQKAYEGKSKFGQYVEVPVFFVNKAAIRISSEPQDPNQKTPSSSPASFDRLLIYKTPGGLLQRIITYVPDAAYLSKHNNDVSHNQISKLDEDFSGYLLYRNIAGDIRFVLKIVDGKAVKKLKVTQKPQEKINARTQDFCIYPFIEHWLQDCTITAPDGPSGPLYENCGFWYLDWVEWLEPICEIDPDEDPCLDPANACTAECNDMGYCGDPIDCAGVLGGSAYMSACGCVGGTTGIICVVEIDPCTEAQPGAYKATTLSQNNVYTTAKGNIQSAASDGNEHGISFGRDNLGNVITSSITTGNDHSGSVGTVSNRFADLHNHPNEAPPSSGDLYGFIDLASANSTYETRYVVTPSGGVYAFVVTNIQQARDFNTAYPRVPNPGYEPGFPDSLVDEFNELKGWYGATDEMAMAFILAKYNAGVALLRQDPVSGSFKRLNTEETIVNGNRVYTANNCQ